MLDWLFEFMQRGGVVLWGILFLCLLLWSLILERLWFFYISFPRQTKHLISQWQTRSDRYTWFAQKIRLQRISQQRQLAESSLALIATLIAVCPLMGLLGTVTGMVKVFDVLAITGTGNARAMASGISQATIPTMAGLVVALTGLYFRNRFQRLTENGLQRLNERLTLTLE